MPEIEIRDNPKLRGYFRSITEMTFTGFVWGIWVYMLLPIANVIMWIVGVRFIDAAVIEQLGYKQMIELIAKMGWIVIVVFLVLRLWGYYNYIRFGKKSRRKGSQVVTSEQLATHFQIPSHEVEILQMQKEVTWPHTK
ncbi:MAG: poly-beta-1,6-N-acetyl-D-glucosamine biosynthesis protein PgaD [Nitrospiraceae bacterium]|nr:MAG: poly-beta-1,6-N-acetyl-D-glucosamine biosynthesis protein PgaD [Nitrospiraceae bacterium]